MSSFLFEELVADAVVRAGVAAAACSSCRFVEGPGTSTSPFQY